MFTFTITYIYIFLGGEALLLFSSNKQIRGFYINSKVYFSVSTQMKRVIGLSHNGHHIYWTEIDQGEAAIVKSNEDGSDRFVIADSGILPEVEKGIFFLC